MHLSRTLAAAVLAVTTIVSPALAAGTVTSTSGLNVRSSASTSASVVTALPYGAEVDVIGSAANGTWYQISYGNVTGYVSGQYIQLNEQYCKVVEGPLNIRSGAGTSFSSVGQLATGTVVEVQEILDGWYKIDQGYICSDYVEMCAAPAAQPAAQSAAPAATAAPAVLPSADDTIASFALQFKGYPYVYGGSSPSSGFDCSGLVYYVCRQLGYSVNRTATAQLSNGTPVSRDQLQPGDLVFFNSNGTGASRASHVGIYIGNNQFIHASTPTVGVIVSSLSEPYHSSIYTTARRL